MVESENRLGVGFDNIDRSASVPLIGAAPPINPSSELNELSDCGLNTRGPLMIVDVGRLLDGELMKSS